MKIPWGKVWKIVTPVGIAVLIIWGVAEWLEPPPEPPPDPTVLTKQIDDKLAELEAEVIDAKGHAPMWGSDYCATVKARIKELEAKIGGSGSKDPDPEKDLESVSGGPGDEGASGVESQDGELNLDGANSVADIMKTLQAFEG